MAAVPALGATRATAQTTTATAATTNSQAQAAATPALPPSKHRIATCNILLDQAVHKGTDLDWHGGRREYCIELIQEQNADVICLQEVAALQNKDFTEAFQGYRQHGFVGPTSDRNLPGFAAIRNVIYFRDDRYEQTSAGGYTLSYSPLEEHVKLPGEGVGLARHVSWVRLKDRKTGGEMRVLNTHWSLKTLLRQMEARIMAQEAAQYLPDFPQILCGDLNSNLDSPEQTILQAANWSDSYLAVNPEGSPGFWPANKRIDMILLRGKVRALGAHRVEHALKNGLRPSDHPFFVSDVEI